ncbi:SpoVR family protein [Salicibibacter halophilus]|uniref:SpoVR family protein n=1 Tax=Salicibibacter halophilus TaxID=2502791 RepID=A0A514LMK7_9BACI|nr:SpoVR family protein [Salicibibacter halophilus]QDI92775.1 SpoVR family protein [Salicibibacter halophilus]
MSVGELRQLENKIEAITEIAKGFGLDFFPMRYEVCPADIIYTFGAYGMPTRFSHWSFGKQFYKMKVQYDLGLSKIYELVINSNPCYAFLLNNNSLIQNQLIVAHVLAHSDFFKNNYRFRQTRQDMVESMGATAERIASYEQEHGRQEVETFLDAVLAIQEHVDPSMIKRRRENVQEKEFDPVSAPYADLWEQDEPRKPQEKKKKQKFPAEPEKDIMWFIEENSLELEEWQRDIMTMMREEMLYFWPQMETKIMNEGWASYWHARIMREMTLNSSETIEFSQLNANVITPSKTSINPYYLGLKIFEDIEERYDNPDEGMKERGVIPGGGREKIFEVRELETDQSFIRNYLTQDFVEREDLYVFAKKGSNYEVVDKDWTNIRDELVASRVNGGFPHITVTDGDYLKAGELFLTHNYEGTELDVDYLEKTLPYIYQLWGRPVHLESVIQAKPTVFTFDGRRVQRKTK